MISSQKLIANENKLLITDNSTTKSAITSDSFLGQLSTIMADDQVRKFFTSYFKTWSDARPALMLLQTYVAIDEAYAQEYNGNRLSSEKIAAIVREMVANSECRQLLAQAMNEFTTTNNEKFIEAYQKVALRKKQLHDSNAEIQSE